MSINTFSGEGLQAHPADVRPTPRTRDMITTLIPLYRNLATWTILHTVFVHLLPEQSIATVLLRTPKPIVILHMTFRTYPCKTRRAL